MTTRGQPCPELGRRIASLYQDKEVRMKSRINEENTFKDFGPEISGFYNREYFVSLSTGLARRSPDYFLDCFVPSPSPAFLAIDMRD
jgi:hypothetical protein